MHYVIYFKSMKGMVLIHLYTRSLWNKKDSLCNYLENSNIDVFKISESWLHSNIPDALHHISGYTLFRNDRDPETYRTSRSGGGVAMYIKHDLQINDMKMINFNRSTKDMEMLWISLRLTTNNKAVFVCSVYRPPKGDPITLVDTLCADIEHLRKYL